MIFARYFKWSIFMMPGFYMKTVKTIILVYIMHRKREGWTNDTGCVPQLMRSWERTGVPPPRPGPGNAPGVTSGSSCIIDTLIDYLIVVSLDHSSRSRDIYPTIRLS